MTRISVSGKHLPQRHVKTCPESGSPAFNGTSITAFPCHGETWTLNQEMLDRLNGCYTRLLRITHNVDWTAHARNSFLYGNGTIPPLAHTIAKRTLRFAGHAFQAKDQLVPDIMMFEPRPMVSQLSYLKNLCHLMGATKEELSGLMSD